MAGGLIGSILNFIRKVWDFIKKIVVKIVSFFKHIVGWARNTLKRILQNLEDEKKIRDIDFIVVKIEENIERGNFSRVDIGLKEQLVQCAYDREKGEIVDWENTARVISFEDLDTKTKQAFGDKDMIILQ
jgi:hypothetical protein